MSTFKNWTRLNYIAKHGHSDEPKRNWGHEDSRSQSSLCRGREPWLGMASGETWRVTGKVFSFLTCVVITRGFALKYFNKLHICFLSVLLLDNTSTQAHTNLIMPLPAKHFNSFIVLGRKCVNSFLWWTRLAIYTSLLKASKLLVSSPQ